MVTFFIGALLVSTFGMVFIISAKRYELSTGKVLFARLRPSITRRGSRLHFVLSIWLPAYVHFVSLHGLDSLKSLVQRTAARVVLLVERVLERVLTEVKTRTTPTRAPGEASPFLREVGKYKEELTNGERQINE
jgi:hypothetical protein